MDAIVITIQIKSHSVGNFLFLFSFLLAGTRRKIIISKKPRNHDRYLIAIITPKLELKMTNIDQITAIELTITTIGPAYSLILEMLSISSDSIVSFFSNEPSFFCLLNISLPPPHNRSFKHHF